MRWNLRNLLKQYLHQNRCNYTISRCPSFSRRLCSGLRLNSLSVCSSRRACNSLHPNNFGALKVKNKRLKYQGEYTQKSLTDKILTRIRCKRLHIEILRYAYRRRYFLPPRKSFQMYHQYFWKPENCYVFVHFVDGFALGALVSTLFHFLCFYEILKALLH